MEKIETPYALIHLSNGIPDTVVIFHTKDNAIKEAEYYCQKTDWEIPIIDPDDSPIEIGQPAGRMIVILPSRIKS